MQLDMSGKLHEYYMFDMRRWNIIIISHKFANYKSAQSEPVWLTIRLTKLQPRAPNVFGSTNWVKKVCRKCNVAWYIEPKYDQNI